MKTFICYNWTESGRHRFPGHRTLGVLHTHLFKFSFKLEEIEGDRGIEFLEFGKVVENQFREMFPKLYGGTVLDFGDLSCEQLTRIIGDILFKTVHPGYILQVPSWDSHDHHDRDPFTHSIPTSRKSPTAVDGSPLDQPSTVVIEAMNPTTSLLRHVEIEAWEFEQNAGAAVEGNLFEFKQEASG